MPTARNWILVTLSAVQVRFLRTRTGEISIHAQSVDLLSKSLLPLPEKFHGLKDPDLRYRQRYVDLIVNPEVKNTFIVRSEFLSELRRYMSPWGIWRLRRLSSIIIPPMLGPVPLRHTIIPWIWDMYLRVELELHLKRLIIGGIDKVFEIGRIFRNEGMSVRHNPEFTMMELYEAYTDYHGMMERIEGIFTHVTQTVLGTLQVPYQDAVIDMTTPWKRMTMAESVKEYSGVDFSVFPPMRRLVPRRRPRVLKSKGCYLGRVPQCLL